MVFVDMSPMRKRIRTWNKDMSRAPAHPMRHTAMFRELETSCVSQIDDVNHSNHSFRLNDGCDVVNELCDKVTTINSKKGLLPDRPRANAFPSSHDPP